MATTSAPASSTLLRGLLASPWLRPLNDADAIEDLVGIVRPTWSLTKIHARVVEARRETADTRTLVLEPNRNWPGHRAGQHVVVEAELRGRRVQRTFSISSAPRSDGRITVTVKRHARGNVSAWWNEVARVGDVVTLSKPAGDFVLPSALPPRLVMVSAGSGITPVMAMLRELDARAEGPDGSAPAEVHFVHVARSRMDAIFVEELGSMAARRAWLKLSLHFTATDGRFDEAGWSRLAREAGETPAFVCGPGGFMEAARHAWREAGVEAQLRMEHFGLAPLAAAATQGGFVTAAKTGRSFVAEAGQSLLVAAEAAGLQPKHGCRMGICHTCVCRKIDGTTVDLRTGRVSSEPGEIIQLCVMAPRSAVTLDL